MPNNIVKSFAQKTGKPESEVESLWNKSKDVVKKKYPEVEEGSEKFYKLLTGVLKNMLSIKTEDNPDGGISYSDVKPGTYAGITTYHRQKRSFKKTVNEAINKMPKFNSEELGVFNALQAEGNNIAITMIEQAISTDQLRESIEGIRAGTITSDSMMFLDSIIKEAIADKQRFARFIEQITEYLFDTRNLNEDALEYPGYDLGSDDTLYSIKSSTTRHSVSEAFRNSNSIKTSALILSSMYRYDPQVFKEKCNFSDISDLLDYKDALFEFVALEDKDVRFSIAFINKDNNLCVTTTNPIKEFEVLKHCFEVIETANGKLRSKFFSSYSKLKAFTEGDSTIKIKLLDNDVYSDLREQIIDTISNIKDYDLMRKIEMLLR